MERARAAFWGSDLDGADALLEDLLKGGELTLEGWLLYAQVAWFRAMLSEDKEEAKVATVHMDQCAAASLISTAHTIQEQSIGAEMVLMKALLALRMGNYLTGGWQLRKAWLLFQELSSPVKLSSTDQDTAHRITFVVAAFHFFVSITPPTLQFIVSALGFSANRASGIEQLYRCLQSHTTVSPLAGNQSIRPGCQFTNILSRFDCSLDRNLLQRGSEPSPDRL